MTRAGGAGIVSVVCLAAATLWLSAAGEQRGIAGEQRTVAGERRTADAGRRVIEGKVIRVVDGDTIEIVSSGAKIRVRLSGIDTPERGQPWAEESRAALLERVQGREVRVNEVAIDRYGRSVGEVYADDVCVGCELVREGHAWVYRRFTDDRVLLELEAQARIAKRGLWGLPETQRIAPWEWRREHGPRESQARKQPVADARCGSKTQCREMTTCAEARFYLERCGLTGIDGDRDGVPCERICSGR